MSKVKQAIEKMHRTTREMVEATPELKAVAAKLKTKLHEQAYKTLFFYYEVGEVVDKVSLDPDTYGDDAVDRLADQLNVKLDALRQNQKVFLTFSREQLASIADHAVKTGVSITLAHLLNLAALPDEAQIPVYLDQIFEKGWSANDLRREIMAKVGPKVKAGAGRPPKRPTSPRAGYTQMAKQYKSMCTLFDGVWGEVFDEVEQISADHIDEELLDRLIEADKNAAKLGEGIKTARRRMASNKKRCKAVIEQQQASEEAAEELDDDPFADPDDGWNVD